MITCVYMKTSEDTVTPVKLLHIPLAELADLKKTPTNLSRGS